MSRLTDGVAALALLLAAVGAQAQGYSNIGRAATPAEITAWDSAVRPDFKGLPKGSGSVAQGQQVWDGKCASCHGTFGESNQVFTPLVGGTTKADIHSGHVAALANNTQPQRTTLMKLATVSTLFDYIRRAMPWTAPKSLTTQEVYAVTAYILNLGEIVPDEFTLSDQNIGQVQTMMPNRNGMTRAHGLWQTDGKPDVVGVACMHDCARTVTIVSSLPASARGATGNPAEQNRPFGPVRGVDTAPAKPVVVTPAGSAAPALVTHYACTACHGVREKIVGPGFREIAARYQADAGAQARLVAKVRQGGSGVWGAIPMPAQTTIKDEELALVLEWIRKGAPE